MSRKGQVGDSNLPTSLPTTILLLFALYNPGKWKTSICSVSVESLLWLSITVEKTHVRLQPVVITNINDNSPQNIMHLEMGIRALTLPLALCRTLNKSQSASSVTRKEEGRSTDLSRVFFSVCKSVYIGRIMSDLSPTGHWWSQSLYIG